jgi:sortase A
VQPGQASGILGRALVAIGLLFLLFVAYLWWGTAITESHHQAQLRDAYNSVLHRARSAAPVTAPGSTPATTTLGAVVPAPPMTAPSDGEPVGIITIPEIGLNAVVVEGTDTADLRTGPGHYPGTPLPGENGNVAIAGHRTTYGRPFYDLNELNPGDLIHFTTVQGSFTYAVTGTIVVSPDDVSVANPTSTPELTLTTCNPRYSASTRMVVHASLVGAVLTGSTASSTSASSPPAPSTAHPTVGTPNAGGGSWVTALGWGLLVLLLAAATTWLTRRLRARGTLAAWSGAILGWAACLVALYVFFGAISPLLPASL